MRAVFAALAANLGIAVAKFIAFVFTGSASMLAESVHSVADTGNEVLLLVGRGRSLRPPSDEHPFGFGRERYFYGFVVSVMLFTVGAAFSVYDGLHKILNPEPVRSPLVALAVLALSAVLEGFSLRTGISEANKVRGDRNWGTFIRRTKAPELPVVLLEDLAALIGLGFAFAGVTLAALTGNGRWDGAGSLAIGVLLATAAAILAVEMKSLLIGEAASAEVQRQIVAALEDGTEVDRVIHMRTVHISPDSILVAAKIAVRATDTAAQVAAGIDAAEQRVRAAVPIASTIYLEPDIYRPSRADQTDPSIRAVALPGGTIPPRPPAGPGGPPRPPASPGPPLGGFQPAGGPRPVTGAVRGRDHPGEYPARSRAAGARDPALPGQRADGVWLHTEQAAGQPGLDPPFWAFAWAGGQALARYLLDHPEAVTGRQVIDVASGSGLVAIAAALAGAAAVTAYDIDPLAAAAITVNAAANGVTVRAVCADVLGDDGLPAPGTDLVLVADAFYERDLAGQVLRFLERGHARGAAVLAGDFGRAYLPRARLAPLASYDVPGLGALEDTDVKRTTVWTLR